MIGVNVQWVNLALWDIPSATVLTLDTDAFQLFFGKEWINKLAPQGAQICCQEKDFCCINGSRTIRSLNVKLCMLSLCFQARLHHRSVSPLTVPGQNESQTLPLWWGLYRCLCRCHLQCSHCHSLDSSQAHRQQKSGVVTWCRKQALDC